MKRQKILVVLDFCNNETHIVDVSNLNDEDIEDFVFGADRPRDTKTSSIEWMFSEGMQIVLDGEFTFS